MEAQNPAHPLVLIVDDFEDNRAMYAEYASICGFEVVEAKDGEDALEKASVSHPDIVVLDLCLPKVTGSEVIKQLKSDAATSNIPILVVTGHATEGHTHDAWEAGCDALLTKPCLPDKLVEQMRALLDGKSRKTG